MDSRERVRRAVEFDFPDRVPFEWYKHGVNQPDYERTDILWVHYKPLEEPLIEEKGDEVWSTDEWGCTWVSYKSIPTMGQPLVHPLQDWENLCGFRFPDIRLSDRFQGVDDEIEEFRGMGKYVIGALDFGVWERLHFMRGLNETVLDLYRNQDRVELLLDKITEFKLELINGYAELGVDCVGFTDDWGDQLKLMINPTLWVKMFKSHYVKIFNAAKSHGMHTFLHSCGNISTILEHLIDAGLDIIQIDAPHQNSVKELSKYKGRTCFDCCIDIQKVLVTGDARLIDKEARLLTSRLGSVKGGFIARQYPQLLHIGVSYEASEMAYNSFEKWGRLS